MPTISPSLSSQVFWDKIAPKYAKKPIADPSAYERKLARLRTLLRPEDRMLEIGCGTGSTALALAFDVAEITATDCSKEMLRIAEAKRVAAGVTNVSFFQADAAEHLPDAPYDVVTTFSLLHLLDNVPQVLSAVFKQVKPGGLFISKTICLGGSNLAFRLLVRALVMVGVAPPVTFLTEGQLIEGLGHAGFEVLEALHFGKDQRKSFIVARRPSDVIAA